MTAAAKTAHTLGPWRILRHNRSEYIESPSSIICSIWAGGGPRRDRVAPVAELYANARLIAAAPEMADLLRRLDRYVADNEADNDESSLAREIRDLLARIDGQEAGS